VYFSLQYVIPHLKGRDAEAVYYQDPEITATISLNVLGASIIRPDNKLNRQEAYLNALGNRILSRRLSALAQNPDAPFISGGASTYTAYDAVQISSVSMSVESDQWALALELAEQELRRAIEFGFTNAEINEQIENTKQALKVRFNRQETRRTPSLARQILGSFGSDTVMTSPEFDNEFFNSYADEISAKDVHNRFKTLWAGFENPQIYLSTPEIMENAEDEIIKVLRESQKMTVSKSEEVEIPDFAYSDFGPPGKVKTRKQVSDVDFEQVVFENGMRLNLKKTPYQKGIMSIQLTYGKGDLFFESDEQDIRWFLRSALELGGLGAHSTDELRTIMAGKSVGVGHGVGARHMYMSGGTTPEYLSEQLNLTLAYYLDPGFRVEAKSRHEKSINSYYPTLDSTPSGVASRDIGRLIRSNDPRYGIPGLDILTGASLEAVASWYDLNVPGEYMELAVVGDFDPDKVISEVARTFGTLPDLAEMPPQLSESQTRLIFPEGTSRPVKLSHAGETDTAMLRVYWPAPDGVDDMVLRRVNVLEAVFQLRLTEVLREELGASYSPSSFSLGSRLHKGYGYLGVSVEVSPEKINSVERKIFQIAEEISASGVSPEQFDRAIQPMKENIESSLESNAYWMGIIGQSQSDPERVERHRRRKSAYDLMKPEDLDELAVQIFVKKNAYVVHILPEE